LVGADEECGVGAFGVVGRGEVEEDVFAVFLVVQEFLHFSYVFPDLGDVQWPEVLEEAFVDEVLGGGGGTSSMLKKKALGTSFGGLISAMKKKRSV
jgi:hypothetical protein